MIGRAPPHVISGAFVRNRDSPQSRDLVAWWPIINGGVSRVEDRSGNGLHLTALAASNIPTRAFGPMTGAGASFDGSDDYYYVAHYAALNPAEITLTAWAAISTTATNYGNILEKSGNSGYRFRVDDGTNTVTFLDRGGTNVLTSTGTVALREPTLITVTGSAAGLAVYLQGRFDSSNATAYGAGATADQLDLGSATSNEFFPGMLWDARIYKRALSSAEVWALYDPRTRYDLYLQSRRKSAMDAIAAATAKVPYWHLYAGANT